MTRRRKIPPRNIHPHRNTTPILRLDLRDIRIAPTPTPNPILLLRVPLRPILVLFFPALPLFLQRRRADCRILARIVARAVVGRAGQLAGGRVRRAVLDGGVAVAEVAEVVDV